MLGSTVNGLMGLGAGCWQPAAKISALSKVMKKTGWFVIFLPFDNFSFLAAGAARTGISINGYGNNCNNLLFVFCPSVPMYRSSSLVR